MDTAYIALREYSDLRAQFEQFWKIPTEGNGRVDTGASSETQSAGREDRPVLLDLAQCVSLI